MFSLTHFELELGEALRKVSQSLHDLDVQNSLMVKLIADTADQMLEAKELPNQEPGVTL